MKTRSIALMASVACLTLAGCGEKTIASFCRTTIAVHDNPACNPASFVAMTSAQLQAAQADCQTNFASCNDSDAVIMNDIGNCLSSSAAYCKAGRDRDPTGSKNA